MKTVLITDTNIWIDLENGNLLGTVFRLPYRLITLDLARIEIKSTLCQELEGLGLEFASLLPQQMQELIDLRNSYRALSIVDLRAYILAHERNATLLSGDGHLTRFARSQGVLVHGVLWVLDELMRCQLIGGTQATNLLHCMLTHAARLSREECIKRMEE